VFVLKVREKESKNLKKVCKIFSTEIRPRSETSTFDSPFFAPLAGLLSSATADSNSANIMSSGSDESSASDGNKVLSLGLCSGSPFGLLLFGKGIKAFFLFGSMLFLLGSILFYPGLHCPYYSCFFWGAFSFIIGSISAFGGSVLLTIKNFERLKRGNIIMMCSDPLANGLFIIGSVFFLPSITKIDGVIEGVLFFTFGCVILVLNSLLNIHIALSSHDVVRDDFLFILARELCLIIGSLLFIVGSIMFIPLFFHQYVVNFFIIGSLFFISNHVMFFCSSTTTTAIQSNKERQDHSYVRV
jgi:hypothetical protein